MESEGAKLPVPIFKDIRRYYCEFCGICRSKKSLLASHMLTHHKEEMEENEDTKEEDHEQKLNVCEECGANFRKPAHLKQHLQSHSLERSFMCPVNDCQSSYRRKDHLTRHMLKHEGKLFECPVSDCKSRFAYHGNMTRHVKEFHDDDEDDSSRTKIDHPKECACAEPGCGKVFKYPSQLRKHEDSHVKLDSVEAFCVEPGCLKYFSNDKCLREHIRSFHRYIICETCGKKQLKKNIKRHIRTHEGGVSPLKVECNYEGCSLTFSTASNLKQHIKAVHLQLKPFVCGSPGCNMRFAFKHVRDNHEKSGCHVYTPGDFEESDEQFQSRPRGGRKRKYPVIETLMRKRIVPPEIEIDEEHGTGISC
ncbi:transcription factor IIIA-like [Andrographis paniculata]|uniref:transcription factor IIIA-like n=1 Tax=Andrographis paniculata TaxID=175694 RepID=UPI0021E81291|nr:transcription factor IIIA-like [Andrographis paniculata]XP_051141545.1 transcription factor IIIA-like [Andrographis paniculata]